MRKLLFHFLLIMVCIQGCIKRVDSYTVYNDVLLDVIGTGRYHVPFNSIFEYDSLTQEKLLNEYIHAKNRPIDQRKLVLAIYDTLNIHFSDLENIAKFGNNSSLQDSILIEKIIAENSNAQVVDLEKLPTIGRYELFKSSDYKSLRNHFKENQDIYSRVGFIRISNVVFTDNKQQGCFYFQIVDQGGHGHPASLVFIEKDGAKWKVLKEKVI